MVVIIKFNEYYYLKYDQQNAKLHKSLYVDFVKVIKYLEFAIVIRYNLKEKVHLS